MMLRQRCLPGAADGSSSRSGSHTWREELAELRGLYTAGHVFAWSICDSICGRLLGPLIKQLLKGPAPAEGQACARAVMGWCREEALWLRRSSVVAFVTLARLPDEQVFPGFRAALLDTLAVTVKGQERFAQTGTGWVLREVGKGDAGQLLQFVEANLPYFNAEGLRYALEKQPTAVRRRLYAAHKAAAARAGSSGGGADDDSQQQAKRSRRS
ncbi:DNA alkylation repair enzyme [Micractinium conductrix]|uniref:DNA alkylation repair enzyme n=1 Tax=Micractinium conductrix TaxID=554055 RepID=A0A2P6VB78_9CHLO|nr:DNA alkylation repair enzyme [Micractinium conductrix]|eukprot:PSC71345.1 DNA alkylation repair enzyme [Micractinium conductrix]